MGRLHALIGEHRAAGPGQFWATAEAMQKIESSGRVPFAAVGGTRQKIPEASFLPALMLTHFQNDASGEPAVYMIMRSLPIWLVLYQQDVRNAGDVLLHTVFHLPCEGGVRTRRWQTRKKYLHVACTSLLTCYFLGDLDLASFKNFVYSDLHGHISRDPHRGQEPALVPAARLECRAARGLASRRRSSASSGPPIPAAPLWLNAARGVPGITELHGRLTGAVRSAAREDNGCDRSCVLR